MRSGRWIRALRFLRLVTVGVVPGFLAACSDDDFGDLHQYVTEVKSRKKEAVPPLPEVKIVEPFLFRADELRDPFVRAKRSEETVEPGPANSIRPDLTRPKEELESYELDTLRMVGTLTLRGELWGLVKATDGTIHRVRPGNFMGRNFGRIIALKPDRIELVEIIPERPGYWQERPAALDLIEPVANSGGGAPR